MRRTWPWVCFAALAGVAGWLAFDMHDRLVQVARHVEELWRNKVQTLTNSWKSGTMDVTVSTVRKEGESLDDWRARHREAVRAEAIDFPPNP